MGVFVPQCLLRGAAIGLAIGLLVGLCGGLQDGVVIGTMTGIASITILLFIRPSPKELEKMVGIFRAETDGYTAVGNYFAEAETYGNNPVNRFLGCDGIEVIRLGDTGKIRIKPGSMGGAYHLLNDHGHLFLLNMVCRDFDVIFGALVKG